MTASPRCGGERRRNHAWLYDPLVKYAFLPFGGESRYRQGFIQFAEIKAGEKILDACCGTGTLTHKIAGKVGEKGEVIGVDLSNESLQVAESKQKEACMPPVFRQASCADLPFPDGYFDKVCVSFGLHEIAEADRPQSLLEFRRVLKKDGALFIMDYHSPTSLIPALTLKAFIKFFESEAAYRMVFNQTLLPELERAGFTVVDKRLMGVGIIQVLQVCKITEAA